VRAEWSVDTLFATLSDDPGVAGVTAIVRRPLGVSHSKMKEILHRDFADCSALAGALSGQDAAVFCLGTYTGAVSDAHPFHHACRS